jgi:hypothetical protein
MVLIFTPDDVAESVKDLPVKLYSFKGAMSPIKEAEVVLYVDDVTVHVLKNRYGPLMTFNLNALLFII